MHDEDFTRAAISWLTAKGYTVSTGAAEAPVEAFEEFWALYPRKAGRAAAEKAFSGAQANDVLVGLHIWLGKNGFPSDPKYVPHASTWINQRRYLDAPEPRKAAPQIGGRTRKALDAFLDGE